MLVRFFYDFLVYSENLCTAEKSKKQDDDTVDFPLKEKIPVVTRRQHCCRQEGFLREVSTQMIQHQPKPLTPSLSRYWILFTSDFIRHFLSM